MGRRGAGIRSSYGDGVRQPEQQEGLGVLENGDFSFLAVVDLQGLLSAARTGHVVNEPLPAGLVTFIAE